MSTSKNQSQSMKNKSKMWGGDKTSSTGGTKKSAQSAKSSSGTPKASSATKAKSSSTKSNTAKSAVSAKGGKKMNSKTEFAQDMTALNDVEIISDILNTQKGLVKLYGTALCESSCENMRTLVGQHLTECGEDQFDVFLYMSERNLYPTEEAPTPKLNKAKEKFKGYEQKMKK